MGGRDESDQKKEVVERACLSIRNHRFRCSIHQSTCFSITALGNNQTDCHNGYDEKWIGTDRRLSDMACNSIRKDDCFLIRQYIKESWSTMNTNNILLNAPLSFRSYCDTFSDLKSMEDENLVECKAWWKCAKPQYRCNTGQCAEWDWINDSDGEWDCADASDESTQLDNMTRKVLKALSIKTPIDKVTWASETCHSSSSFICLSAHSPNQRQLRCLNHSQLGDRNIDCLGAIDERNTIQHCSSSSMLGYNFFCVSTRTCIPFSLHCQENHRCPNRTDDDQWCSRSIKTSPCNGENDFACFDGVCIKGGRCDEEPDCLFDEDEYMCDYEFHQKKFLMSYRISKLSRVRRAVQFVTLPLLPDGLNITSPTASIIVPIPESFNNTSNLSQSPAASLTPYVCNRGIGILSSNDSIVCFCPPQYFGPHCEYHADRLLLLLHLNFSHSNYAHQTDPSLVIKLLVLFLFHDGDDDQILMSQEFHVRPALEMSIIKKKMVTLPYSRSFRFRQHRQDRYRNRSDIIHSHPYAIRIEAYEMSMKTKSFLIAVWQYPIIFDYLPVFRFAKVLNLTDLNRWSPNPCSSQSCPPNSQCHRLMNDRHRFVCLCKPDYTGKNCTIRDEHCVTRHCANTSLCLPKYRSLLRGNQDPYCVCPLNRYGDRCDIIHDDLSTEQSLSQWWHMSTNFKSERNLLFMSNSVSWKIL